MAPLLAASQTQRSASPTDQGGHRFQHAEFISVVLDKWAYDHGVTINFLRPGKPTDNPFIESFNASFRDECLNAH